MPSAEASITGRHLQLLGSKRPEPPKPAPNLEFRNCYSSPRYVSLGWYNKKKWTTQGLWAIGPGDTAKFNTVFHHLPNRASLFFRVQDRSNRAVTFSGFET